MVIRLKVPIEMHYTVIPMGTSEVNSSLITVRTSVTKHCSGHSNCSCSGIGIKGTFIRSQHARTSPITSNNLDTVSVGAAKQLEKSHL